MRSPLLTLWLGFETASSFAFKYALPAMLSCCWYRQLLSPQWFDTVAGCASTRIIRLTIAMLAIGVAGAAVVVSVCRTSPENAFNKALAALERGDVTGVEGCLTVLDRHPEYSEHARLLDGLIFLRGHRLDAALARFYPPPRSGALRPFFLLYAAQAFYEANQLVQAEVLLRTLSTEYPTHVEARRWLGIVYYDLGAFDAAITELNLLSELSPSDYRPYRLIGLMQHDFEQDTDAILSYQRALERSPPQAVHQEILRELAESFVNLRRYEEASKVLQQAVPTAAVLALSGQCAWSLGRVDEALAHVSEARQFDSNDRRLLLLEAEMKTAAGDLPGALDILRGALEKHAHDAETRYRYALALKESGFAREAEEEMVRWNQAKDLAVKLTELNFKALGDPYDASVRDKLAEVCQTLGKDELAAMWRRAADACRVLPQP